MVAQLKQDPKNVFIEIEGTHGQRRRQGRSTRRSASSAREAVERYLYEQHQIPLHKMNVISYGEDEAGRAEQDEGRPRPEPPRRHQVACSVRPRL